MASSKQFSIDEKMCAKFARPPVSELTHYNPIFELPSRHKPHFLDATTRYRISRIRRNVNFMPHRDERQLRLAATVANSELLTRLLLQGIDPNCVDQHKRSSLHLAASRGYIDVVLELLRHGANPNLQDSLGNTPLHLAACSATTSKYNEICKMLLNYGARVDIADRSCRTPEDLVRSKLNIIHLHGYEDADLTRELSNLCRTLTLCRENNQRKMDKSIDTLGDHFEKLSTNEVVTDNQNILAQIGKLNIE